MANQKVKTKSSGSRGLSGRWCKRTVAKDSARKARRTEDTQAVDEGKAVADIMNSLFKALGYRKVKI